MSLTRRLRVGWSIVAGWTFTVVFCVAVIASALLTLGLCARWLTPLQARFWGRTALRIQGVRVEYEGLEHLAGDGMRVATFNHSSGLDPMLITTLYTVGSTSAIKREVLYIPIVGLTIYLMGFLLIDRQRGTRGNNTLQSAGRRMEREGLTVFIAPEGTRSHDGSLSAFKTGAFRLALASGAPIVPVVVSGAFEVYPRQNWAARPGVVRMRVLPPIPTTGLTVDALPDMVRDLRARYADELAAMAA
jgi:1-acyl-sn-glycerol-3-phosphate acyltransferase